VLFFDFFDYCCGYFCGVIWGDGYFVLYFYECLGCSYGDVYWFCFVLMDLEVLWRVWEFLVDLDVFIDEFVFQVAGVNLRLMIVI